MLSKGDYARYLGSPNSICQNTSWEEPRFKEKKCPGALSQVVCPTYLRLN